MGIVLRCTGGPCAGEAIAVESELVLGREEPDPGRLGGDQRLSRRHARVFIDPAGQALIEDLGSTNGTWINEQRLSEAHACANGDLLRVGQSTFEIELPPRPGATQVDTPQPMAFPTVAEAPPPLPRLTVLSGPRAGEEIPLTGELLLGRSFGEPGALGGDRRLSRRHARIAPGPGGIFFVEDTGSSNGTAVNGVQLRRAVALKDGDEIAVGSSVLQASGMRRAPSAGVALPAAGVALPAAGVALPAAGVAPPAAGVAFRRRAAAAPPPAAAFPPPRRRATSHPRGRFRRRLPAPPPPGAAVPPMAEPAPAARLAPGQFAPQGAAVARLSSRRGRVIGMFAAVFAAAAHHLGSRGAARYAAWHQAVSIRICLPAASDRAAAASPDDVHGLARMASRVRHPDGDAADRGPT